MDYLDPSSITGMNLYTYCGNNPVMRIDPDGNFWDYIFDPVFIVWGAIDLINGGYKDWKSWVAFGVDVLFAVIPFIPSGAGQIIKVGNKIDNAVDIVSAVNKIDNISDMGKIVTVGRNMDRVRDTAKLIGAADNIYDGTKTWQGYSKVAKHSRKLANGISAAHNGTWLFLQLRKGYTVLDIGLSTRHAARGLFYGTETAVMILWKTRNLWKLPLNYYL